MKVILTQDVKGKGKKGQLVEVSDGYGRNFLLPRGLAKEANNTNINIMEGQAASAEYKRQQEVEHAQALVKDLKELTVELKAKAGENGKLFGSITSKDVADELSKQHNIKIDKKKFVLPDGIKSLGGMVVDIKVYPGITAKLKINVTAL